MPAELKKPKSPEKKVKAPKSEAKTAATTKAVLKAMNDRQTTDGNND